MWVKEQDGKGFVQVKQVYLSGANVVGRVDQESFKDWIVVLGVYEDEVRALAIVDDMFTKLAAGEAVYRMPEG